MRFIHTADIHLDYSSGNNEERRLDIYNALATITRAVRERSVEAVVIAGDLFHSIRPTNRSMAFLLSRLMTDLQDENVIIIGGNHDTPKSDNVCSPLDILSFVDNVVCEYRCYNNTRVNDCLFHLVPYTNDRNIMNDRLAQANTEFDPGLINILVMHPSVFGVPVLQYDDLVLQEPELKKLSKKFDYIALGHYHGTKEVFDLSLIHI